MFVLTPRVLARAAGLVAGEPAFFLVYPHFAKTERFFIGALLMYNLEYLGEQADPQPVGSIEINTQYEPQKSAILVFLKLLGLTVLFGVGFAILLPSLPFAYWQSVVLALGIILMYVGVAFFVRPEADTENLGWLAGLADDPLHYSDDLNRGLLFLHMLLGPGRFISGTILDVFALCGLVKEEGPATHEPREDKLPLEPSHGGHRETEPARSPEAGFQPEVEELASTRFWDGKGE